MNQKLDTEKGFYGEKEAISLLNKIFKAEITQLQGNADKGIDLNVQFVSPLDLARINFGVQVKTGRSYVKDLGEYWRLIITRKHFEILLKYSNPPVMVIWVDDITNESYWNIITPETQYNDVKISKKSTFRPTAIYDFLYKWEKHNYYKLRYNSNEKKSKPIDTLLPPLSRKIGFIKKAKNVYKNLVINYSTLNTELLNPSLGKITISNYGWRKMTRAGRRNYYILNSLELLNNLDHFIKLPCKILKIERAQFNPRGNYIFVSRKITTRTEILTFSKKVKSSVTIVYREQIKYPINWRSILNLYDEIERKLVFETIYSD